MVYIIYDDDKATIDEIIQDCLLWSKKKEREMGVSKADYLDFLYTIKDVESNLTFDELRMIFFSRMAGSSYLRRICRSFVEFFNAKIHLNGLCSDISKGK